MNSGDSRREWQRSGGRALFASCPGAWIAVKSERCFSALPPLVSEASGILFSPLNSRFYQITEGTAFLYFTFSRLGTGRHSQCQLTFILPALVTNAELQLRVCKSEKCQ